MGEARSTHLSSTSYGFTNSIFRYFYDVILSNVSLAGGFFALISVFVIVKKPRDNYFGIVVLSFFIPFLFFISSLNLWWERWAMPLIPFACYLAAHGVYISYKIFEHTRLKFFVATSLVIALILP